jgi:hypothetical protein
MEQSRYPLVRRWTPEDHQRLIAMAAREIDPTTSLARWGMDRTGCARSRGSPQHPLAIGDAKAEVNRS